MRVSKVSDLFIFRTGNFIFIKKIREHDSCR